MQVSVQRFDVSALDTSGGTVPGIAEWADDVEHLDHGAGPAVRDDQRQRALVRRSDVDEVDFEAVDLGHELRQGVEPRLDPPEVLVGSPVARELLHGRQLHALRTIRDGLRFGQARGRDPATGGR
jgi:hypothetical protein